MRTDGERLQIVINTSGAVMRRNYAEQTVPTAYRFVLAQTVGLTKE